MTGAMMPKNVVFTNGCFDILHVGHLRLFKYCKSLGEYLVVAIDTDDRVRENKGPSRPVNNLEERIEMLSALRDVDEVRFFSSDIELTNLVKSVEPQFMVVGNDYENKRVVGSEYAKELRFFRRIDGYSTTGKIKNISDR